MTTHVSANTGCNLGCSYCYEEPDREMRQAQIDSEYNMEAIMEELEEYKETGTQEAPGLHGGEPLLLRDKHIDKILSYCYENWGETHIQTNGTLLTDEHIEMFKEYNVSVGISCDGPAELNNERIARSGGEDVTENMTEKTQDAIERCAKADLGTGVIVVLHEVNAGTDERLEKLLDWLDQICDWGCNGHFNPAIPYEDVQTDISLSPERLKEVYLRSLEWMQEEEYRAWGPLNQMVDNLLGLDLGNCVNNTCDVFNAEAAKIIKGDGEWTGCGKTWATVGDGVPFLQGKSSDNEFEETEERYEMLKQTPGPYTEEVQNGEMEDQGGCKGCPYWNVCQGGCPSAGIDDDYRNRTMWCEAKAATYEQIESNLKGLLPSIDLITDFKWDTDVSKGKSHNGELVNFAPFAKISPNLTPNASASNGKTDAGNVYQRANIQQKFEDVVADYKEKYDPEDLTIEPERNSIHADTS